MADQLKALSPAYLHEIFNYDPLSGALTWKVKKGNNIKAGQICGSIDTKGRRRVEIDGKTYGAHQIAFAMYHGRWAENQVDHKNNIKLDNRIDNLREATNQQNSCNRTHSGNTSGFKGVTFHKRQGKYNARIMSNGKMINLGAFEDPQVAAHEYNKAAIAHHGEFALLNPIGSDYV